MASDEFEMIAKFVERLPAPGPSVLIASGDDAAVADHEGPVVVSVDSLIEGVHFTRSGFPPDAIGAKGMAAAVSDLAAMGAEPLHAYAVVGIPEDISEDDLLAVADGIARVAERDAIPVIGGDLTASPQLILSITAIGGQADDVPLVSRAGSRPGDAVVVTGEIGGAAAALRIVEGEVTVTDPEALLERQYLPPSRIAAGQALASGGATAMIDLSDGLGADANRIGDASGVAMRIDASKIPIQEGALEVLGSGGDPEDAVTLAASGGEDYELLASIPHSRIESVAEALGPSCRLTEIGVVEEGNGVRLFSSDGRELPIGGFDHLRTDQA